MLQSDAGALVQRSREYPHMIEAPRVTHEGLVDLSECVLTSTVARRLQTVPDDAPYCFANLLRQLAAIRGSSAVLNLSFNIGEPIVESPGDAIATFLRSGIDALVLDSYVCTRSEH